VIKAFVVVLCASLAAVGCGGGDDGRAAPKTRSVAESTTGAADPATEREVTAVALKYLRAMARRDYATACTTRVPDERRDLAADAGSCAKALEAAFADRDVKALDGARVSGVRREKGLAVAKLALRGEEIPSDDALVAQRVGGRWLLVDLEG
jgi:hypothetical protein